MALLHERAAPTCQGSPAGFGSPVGGSSPAQYSMQAADSPRLLAHVNGGARFSDWVASTSPYAAQRGVATPPSVSMRSFVADENTPPAGAIDAVHNASAKGTPSSAHRFAAWLRATNSAGWTPRRDPSTATPPALSSMLSPMSATWTLPNSAVSPASAEPRSRPLCDLEPGVDADADDDEEAGDGSGDENDEAATNVGAPEVAAAAARMRAALAHPKISATMPCGGSAGQSHAGAAPATPPRAPAPTPACVSPATAMACAGGGTSEQTVLSTAPTAGCAAPASQQQQQNLVCATPSGARARPELMAAQVDVPPSSPIQQVIGLMLHGSVHGRTDAEQAPHSSMRSPGGLAPPPSPEQQVIGLMLDVATGEMGSRPGRALSSVWGVGDVTSNNADGSGSSSSSSDDADSSDDISLSELRELCGPAAAPGTPLSDIINQLATPLLGVGVDTACGEWRVPRGGCGDNTGGPRVLFGDD
jgi:hypothetical protein